MHEQNENLVELLNGLFTKIAANWKIKIIRVADFYYQIGPSLTRPMLETLKMVFIGSAMLRTALYFAKRILAALRLN